MQNVLTTIEGRTRARGTAQVKGCSLYVSSDVIGGVGGTSDRAGWT